MALKSSSTTSKTPLFLFHPGVGEIPVFLALVKHLPERPVYAFRAKGFNAGEGFFCSLEEMVSTYVSAIRTQQPHGPYALAGCSFGGMLAFATAKRLEAAGEQVSFCAIFNLPPHTSGACVSWTGCSVCYTWHFSQDSCKRRQWTI